MGETQNGTESRGKSVGAGVAFGLGTRILTGVILTVLLLGGVGGWAATARISGAVIAPGIVVVDENLKLVQHRDGGIVSEITVKEGDRVEAGQVLVRLDDVQTRAELSIAETQTLELTARRARLIAERDGIPDIEFPSDLGETLEGREFIAGELRLFHGRVASRESQKQQLELGISQIGGEIAGLESQLVAKTEEIALVETENARTESLSERGLIETGRIHTIRREAIRLRGELGEIEAQLGRAHTRISEVRLQILSIDQIAQTEAQRELGDVEARLQELVERVTATRDRLSRADIRAPISGTINELHIHTLGGVITPAQVLITIVPSGAPLKVAIRVSPMNAEQVTLGLTARLRFSAFNQRTTPEIVGKVIHVSPATTEDPVTGERYFQGYVELPADELVKLGESSLLPGMPVEVFVQTEERTVASYLARPVMDQFNRAFRER